MDGVKRLWIDAETRSLSPIKVVGGRRYVDDPTTSVLCLCASDGVRDYVWSPFAGPLGPLGNARPLVVEHGRTRSIWSSQWKAAVGALRSSCV